MSYVVDASVAVKWVAAEPGTEAARDFLARHVGRLIAPDLIVAEVGSALWKKVRKTIVPADQAIDALATLPAFFSRLEPTPELAARALALAVDLRHPIYDAFYLALAERENVTLLTADERLAGAARRLIGVSVTTLGDG